MGLFDFIQNNTEPQENSNIFEFFFNRLKIQSVDIDLLKCTKTGQVNCRESAKLIVA
jgi:hypothetical protein